MRRFSAALAMAMAMVALLMMMMMMTNGQTLEEAIASADPKQAGASAGGNKGEIQAKDIPTEFTRMGLRVPDDRAHRAFYAKDYSRVSYEDFRALWAFAEQAKSDERKLMREHSSDHAIICNKLRKLGLEAIVGAIYMRSPFDSGRPDPSYAAFIQEHLLKFRRNMVLAGKTCKDVRL